MAADGGSVNERIFDLVTGRALDLQRLSAGQQRKARAFLRELEGEIVAKLAKADPTGVSRQSYRAKRLSELLEQIRDTIRVAYRSESEDFAGELRELAEIEAAFAADSVNRSYGVNLMTNSLTRAQVEALVDGVEVQGAPVSEWWERQAGDTLQRFTDQMRLGIAQGETNAQLVRRVRGGTEGGEPVRGIIETSRHHAEALVRSSTQAVSQKTRQTVYEANNDVLKGLMWVSTIDLRTTLLCAARDRKMYEVQGHDPIDHDLAWSGGPGNLHWGCRSSSVPVTKSWKELGFDVDDLPQSTRASADGQIPEDTTFEGWLKRRTQAEQDEYLGPGRAELWREGKITFRDLVSGNGREISASDLRAKAKPKRDFSYKRYPGVSTVAQAEQYLQGNGVAVAASLKGISPKGMSDAVGAAHEVTERFGLKPIDYMGPITRDTRYRYRRVSGANAAVFPSTRAMHLPTKFGDLKDAEKQISAKKRHAPAYAAERNAILDGSKRIDERVRAGVERMALDEYTWSITMGTPAAERAKTMYHEYGHVLHMIDGRAGPRIDEFLASAKPRAGGWDLLLSKYAGSNDHEYIAEAFALYMAKPKAQHFRIHPDLLRVFQDLDLEE